MDVWTEKSCITQTNILYIREIARRDEVGGSWQWQFDRRIVRTVCSTIRSFRANVASKNRFGDKFLWKFTRYLDKTEYSVFSKNPRRGSSRFLLKRKQGAVNFSILSSEFLNGRRATETRYALSGAIRWKARHRFLLPSLSERRGLFEHTHTHTVTYENVTCYISVTRETLVISELNASAEATDSTDAYKYPMIIIFVKSCRPSFSSVSG